MIAMTDFVFESNKDKEKEKRLLKVSDVTAKYGNPYLEFVALHLTHTSAHTQQ